MAPGPLKYYKLRVVYVPIARLIIRIRSRAHGHTYTFGQFHWREGAAPRRSGIGGFWFSGFGHAMPFFSVPGTRLSLARGAAPRRIDTLRRTVSVSFVLLPVV